ncbi:MAG: hypothetical protein GTN84_15290 [Hydrogenophaga sp.]|uniref:CNP1-like family protein n=1 Tax=Hydrogenophaga sp. TaxID=1904254 RepID=UPI0016B19659|nr:CNP1-like family protein [Hydrogenophaga sp.]NIM42532.1 hypothetical protein [Hydrogenophaga sp.]NIN27683.1 hypothetical protein [Hydrogenophaga sp.]NIN32503.1 hypothetical protein [Hydrogenophaga sp.]NIN56954.1 hypothetical protein [Hydrogenophaga sp.]NIO53099.1 hypothetical protein [Hydrogenophaga sp.]
MNSRFFHAAACAAALVTVHGAVRAQYQEPEPWKEAEVALPQRFSTEKLLTVDIEDRSSFEYGIDPDTLSVGTDGVVRYVFVARSRSGAVNVLYEGVRCDAAEVKVYGRWDPGSEQWRTSSTDEWQAMDTRGSTRRAFKLAQTGLCDGRAPNGSPRQILDTLRNGHSYRLR